MRRYVTLLLSGLILLAVPVIASADTAFLPLALHGQSTATATATPTATRLPSDSCPQVGDWHGALSPQTSHSISFRVAGPSPCHIAYLEINYPITCQCCSSTRNTQITWPVPANFITGGSFSLTHA
jgi:hypothetical protein